MRSIHIVWKAALLIAALLWAAPSTACIQFAELPAFNQPGFVPTGKCETCHAGSTGGPRNVFGADWLGACRTRPGELACQSLCPTPLEPGAPLPCPPVPWDDCSLRDEDADGDGYTNHEELLLGSNLLLGGDVDECTLSPCVSIATCDDGGPARGDYLCVCAAGYEGDGRLSGSGCEDVDECDEQTHDCTEDNSSCENVAGSWRCPCDFGFVGQGNAGLGCTQENFCEDDPCHPLSECFPNIGGFDCRACPPGHTGSVEACAACPPGYAGDGIGADGCSNVNECGISDCAPGVACADRTGGRTCQECPSGSSGSSVGADGCVRDVCSECSPFASCDPTRDPPCLCNLGFSGPPGTLGRVCEDVDECERGLAACDAGSSCRNLPGSYLCAPATCAGWEGSCGDGERCDDTGGVPRCVCREGFAGAAPDCVADGPAASPGAEPAPDASAGVGDGQPASSASSGEPPGDAPECAKSAAPISARARANCSLGGAARGGGRWVLVMLGLALARRARSKRRRNPQGGLGGTSGAGATLGVVCAWLALGACGGDPEKPLAREESPQCPAAGAGGGGAAVGASGAGASGAGGGGLAGGAAGTGSADEPAQPPAGGTGGTSGQLDPSAGCTHSRQCGAEEWCNPATRACQLRSLPGEALTFRTDVFTVLDTIGCPGCHSPGEPGDVDPSGSGANLLLDELQRGYASLVAGGVSCQGGPKRLCVDDPASSRLIRQVKEGESTSPESIAFTSWSEEPLQLILRWVARGAPRDSACGNFVRDTGEACDDGPAPRQRCAYGVETCEVCTPSCQIAVGLPGPRCGDGVLDREAETCEPASLVSSEAGPFGRAVCGPDCVFVAGP